MSRSHLIFIEKNINQSLTISSYFDSQNSTANLLSSLQVENQNLKSLSLDNIRVNETYESNNFGEVASYELIQSIISSISLI